MAAPATSGSLRTAIADMAIGDYIKCRYVATAGAAGTFSELGNCAASEIPVSGAEAPDGLFYFIKVDKGLLIADRVLQHTIPWNVLNNAGFIEGKSVTNVGFIRSLTGGAAWKAANGSAATSAPSPELGAWPINNEWDTYLVNSTLGGKITAGADNVWHWNGVYSWVRDTMLYAIYNNAGGRVLRGNSTSKYFSYNLYSGSTNTMGFRPALAFVEAPATTLWQ